jgi:hypothetical protein
MHDPDEKDDEAKLVKLACGGDREAIEGAASAVSAE